MSEEKKSIALSKTVWINAALAGAAVIFNEVVAAYPEASVLVTAAVNLVMRVFTNKPVKLV